MHYEKFADGTVECIEEVLGYELPVGWTFTTIGTICSLQAGKFVSASDISPICLDDMYPCYGGNGIRGYVDHYSLDGDYPIIGRQGALCGNVNMAHGKFYATEHAVVVTPMIDIDLNWLYHILVGLKLNQYAAGAAQPGLAVGNLLKVKLPLPPVNEQKQIAEAVNEAFVQIDALNEAKADFYSIIVLIKSKLLDLAIRGKLVPQDPNDEPASVLLERIRAEKEELIKQGKIKRDKKESVIFKGDDNSYYQELPTSWVYCFLSEIAIFERGITFPSSAKETASTENNIACARTANVQENFDIKDLIYVDRAFVKNNANKKLKINDIIISTANSLELVGKSCIVDELNQEMTFGGFVTVIRGVAFDCRYLHLCLKNKFLKGEFADKSTQTTNIANITYDDLAKIMINLPPLAEQKRIVTAIETAFTQLDEIANAIS